MQIDRIRADFPILGRTVNKNPLVYLDNAASTQKPRVVVEAMNDFYLNDYANIHRAVHCLSQVATERYEGVREQIREFINAPSDKEIIFVRGATEGINLVAQSYVLDLCEPGDEILISEMEHHSNIIPWQFLADRKGVKLRVIPLTETGELDLNQFKELLGPRTRFVSLVHMSNSLGTINPISDMVKLAKEHDIPVLVDGAQSIPHMPVDVQELGCDFFTFSGHKAFGPTGIGALWGRRDLLEEMSPYQGGGDMILDVKFEKTVYNEVPYKFEAGTPNIAGTIGLGAALTYLSELGMDTVADYEHSLLEYGTRALEGIEGLRLIGTAANKGSILSFVMEDIHPHDVGTILDQHGIAVRTGHHCTQPVMDHFQIPATTRASLAFYNTVQDIDRLVDGLKRVQEFFG